MPVDDYVFDEIEEFSSPLGDYFFKRGDYKMMLHEALERRFRPH